MFVKKKERKKERKKEKKKPESNIDKKKGTYCPVLA